MASAEQERKVMATLNLLVEHARTDWRRIWDGLSAVDRAEVEGAIRDGWVAVIEKYGDIAQTLAVDLFTDEAERLGIQPEVKPAGTVPPDKATARLGWAMVSGKVLGNMDILLDEFIKQPYRDTFQDSAVASGAAWARVPKGPETCKFCLLLASRGAVYGSESKGLWADGRIGHRYHGSCDCAVVLVRGPEDYPAGYDPDAMYDVYDVAAQQVFGDGPRYSGPKTGPNKNSGLKAVIAQMRANAVANGEHNVH